MRLYRPILKIHKWAGIIFSIFLLNIATTGFLLLIKKKNDWIQPPTRTGEMGTVEDFLDMDELFQVVFSQNHEDFRCNEDIDRVDFRPAKRVYKVRSARNHSEIQVDAVTGAILSVSWRPSDLIESIHDGSFFSPWVHDWLMPIVAVTIIFLTASGLYLWISVSLPRRRPRNSPN